MHYSLPRPVFVQFFFHPTTKDSFWWSCRYGRYKSKLASHVWLSQKLDPKEKQVINLDQDVQVCQYIYFWWMVDELCCMNHLSLVSFSLDWGSLFFLSSFFLFLWTCLVGMWHTFFEYASFISDMPEHVSYLLWVCIYFLFLHSHISFV